MRPSKRVLVSIAIFLASIPAIAQDLTGIWRDENGTRYVVRQSGSDLCWSMERLPAASSVFCATVMPPLIVGTWLDLPTGQRRGAGQLVLRIDSENRIVRVSDVQGSYGASTWIREGTSGAGGGWGSGVGGGSTGGSSGGGWTAAGPTGGSSAPAASSSGAPPPASPPPSDFTRRQGVTYTGATPIIRFFGMRNAFPQECEAACAKEATCAAYTYVRPGGYKSGDPPVCYLFSQAGYTANHDCCTSGERSTAAGAGAPSGSGRCDAAGRWNFQIDGEVSSVYTLTAQGYNRYTASESGMGNATGTATLTGTRLRIDWTTSGGWAGYNTFELDATCNSGEGSVVFTGGGTGQKRARIQRATPPPAVIPPPPPQARTFADPQVNGMAVDHCATWGANCGQGGADLYCRSQGFVRAASFRTAHRNPSYVQGGGQVCRMDGCVALTEVVCVTGGGGATTGGGGGTTGGGGTQTPPPPPPVDTTSLTGEWTGPTRYSIVQTGASFTWTAFGGAEIGQGTISGNDLQVTWTGGGAASGRISERTPQGLPIAIQWNNGVGFRRVGNTGGGGTQTSGCDDIKGHWFYRVGNSGASIYVFNENFPPGSWAIGGFEVDVKLPGHADRWGPVRCLGNNRFEFRRSNGNTNFVATLRDGKLVQDDGTHWSR